MKIKLLLLLILFISTNSFSQDTFSIVAIDPVTGEVGSAGASCIGGSIILSDVLPGRGVIHTQSYWNAANQNYARQLMLAGYSPQQIIDSLVARDAQNNSSIRQYAIVDLVNGGRTKGFTGVNCFNYKNHIEGPTYCIAGNILLGQQVLDSMEARFLNTQGSLADKLMAALQGAKMPGADTRCSQYGTSSLSTFIRVGRLQDTTGSLYLNLNVNNVTPGVEPIDSLQVLYDQWTMTGVNNVSNELPNEFVLGQNFPNPFNPVTTIQFRVPVKSVVKITVYDVNGKEVGILENGEFEAGNYTVNWDASAFPSGVYFYKLETDGFISTKRMVLLK